MSNRCSAQTQALWCNDTVGGHSPVAFRSGGLSLTLGRRVSPYWVSPLGWRAAQGAGKMKTGEDDGTRGTRGGWEGQFSWGEQREEIGLVDISKWVFFFCFVLWRSWCEECSLSLFVVLRWNKRTKSSRKFSEATRVQTSLSFEEIMRLMMLLSFFLFGNKNQKWDLKFPWVWDSWVST